MGLKRLAISISRAPGAAFVAILATSVAALPYADAAKKISKPQPTPTPSPTPLPTPVPKLQVSKDQTDKPFWKTRASVQKKMQEDRAIVVVVKRDDLPQDLIRVTMQGAGIVQRSKDFCFKTSQDYSRLKDISDHFRTVTFDPQTNQIYMILEALGFQERMIMKLTPVSEDWRSEIQFEVVWGHFTGMHGLLGFEKMDEKTTEVSIQATYEAKELPLPKILMGFALEVITQKVAEKIRTFIESQPGPVATLDLNRI